MHSDESEIPRMIATKDNRPNGHRLWNKTFKTSFCLFMFFFTFYYFTNAGWYQGGDSFFMHLVAKQISQKGKLGFDRKQLPENIDAHEDVWGKGPNGQYYFKWGLGQSLVEVPFYMLHSLIWKPVTSRNITENRVSSALFTELMTVFLCPSLISSIGCVLVFLFGLRLGFSRQVSLLLSLIYGIGTMVWPYSKLLMSEVTLNVALLAGTYGVFSYVSDLKGRWLALSAVCLGFAFMTKVTSVVTIPVVVGYVLFSVRSRKAVYDFIIFFLPLFLASIGIVLWYNLIRYGDFWQFGYNQGMDSLGFRTPLYVGLWGLLLSPGKSYFLYTPISILGLSSAWAFFKKRRPEALMFLGICLTFTLLHALWWSWAGDWAWGPRFLLVITPYMILPAGFFFETWRRQKSLKKVIVILLLVFSISIQVLGVSIHPFSFIESRTRIVNQIVDIRSLTYRSTYSESAFVNFSPMFSHIIGNWWLFKHMFFSYDIWSDVPWQVLGFSNSKPPTWMKGNRTIPFWWPISFSVISPTDKPWIYSLGAINFLFVLWWGLQMRRQFLNDKEPRLIRQPAPVF